MRIDRVKLIAEMARQDMGVASLSEKAAVSRATVTALRGGKSCNANSVRRVASALGVTMESLLEDGKGVLSCDPDEVNSCKMSGLLCRQRE